jgi:predicted MPP superfamily phosphohydrolase
VVHPLRSIVLALGRALRAVSGPRRTTVVSSTDVSIPDLPPSLDGYTIVALGDLHHAPGADLTWLRNVVDATHAAAPNAIVLLGDYGESFRRMPAESRAWYEAAMRELTPELSRLQAPDGVFAILGNHDHYAGAGAVVGWMETMGITMLVNRCHQIETAKGALRIAGVDDLRQGRVDPLAGCGLDAASDTPTIVLSHNPDALLELDERLRVDVVLAGHTHGGQIVLPLFGALVTMSHTCGRSTPAGWVPNQRAPLYVTRGLGEQLPVPMRLNCPAELLVLRLRAEPQQPA